MGDNDIDDVNNRFQGVHIDNEILPQEEFEPYAEDQPDLPDNHYVLIDILNDARTSKNMPQLINGFMVDLGFFNPKKAGSFLEDLLNENETLQNTSKKRKRELLGISDSYYEFWKVKYYFTSEDFGNFIQNIQTNPVVNVRLLEIKNNDHHPTIYKTTFNSLIK